MERLFTLSVILNLIFAASVFAACSSSPLEPESREDVMSYLELINTSGDAIDVISAGALSKASQYNGVPWWQVFGTLLTAERMFSDLKDGDYVEALKTLDVALAKQLIGESAPYITQSFSIASLGGLFIEMGLNNLMDAVDHVGFEYQVKQYSIARGPGYELTHQQILNGYNKNGRIPITYDQGFIRATGELNSYIVRPLRSAGPDAVYGIIRARYEADRFQRLVRDEARDALRSFLEALPAESEETTPLSGRWTGYAAASSTKLAYAWIIEQSGSCLSGTIELALPNTGNFSTYRFVGELEGSTVSFRGTDWLNKRYDRFCLASGELVFNRHATPPVLSGSWGPLDVRDGCPSGVGGEVRLTKHD